MGYRRRYNKRRPVKRYGKRKGKRQYKKRGGVKPAIKSYQTGLPRMMFAKLKYFENNYTYSFGIGDKILRTSIRMNDPFDPYAAVGGKSALYYDFWMQAYRYLRVMAAKITVTWIKTTDTNQGIIFSLCPNLFGSVFADMDDVASQPYVKTSKRIANRVGDSHSISYYIPIHKLLNMTKLQYISQLPGSVYDCGYNNSPTTGALMDIIIGRINEADTTAITGTYMVNIKFFCKLYQRYNFVETGFDAGEEVLDSGEVGHTGTLPPWVFA